MLPSVPATRGDTDIIAITGNTAPDGNGQFSTFTAPSLNNSGQVVFRANLTGTLNGTTDDVGIYRAAVGETTQIDREFLSGIGALRVDNFGSVTSINDAGQVVYSRTVTPGANPGVDQILRRDGVTETFLVVEGNADPGGNGTFSSFGFPTQKAGFAAFTASLTGTSGGSADNHGIFVSNGVSLTQAVREGQAAPDGNGTFASSFGDVALNASGQTAFLTSFNGTSGGSADDRGVSLVDGGVFTEIAREGQAAPNGNGTFGNGFSPAALNDLGQVAFSADFINTAGGTADNEGVYLGSGGALTRIAREGQAAPDGNGILSNFNGPALNDTGQVAFETTLTGTSGGITDNRAVYLGSGGGLTTLARGGQAAPDGNGVFSNFGDPALNDHGQAAFIATLTGTSGGSSDDVSIILANGIDTLIVAREGDPLAGSTINDLFVVNSTSESGDARSGINNHGQVAYRATLANNDWAVVLFTIPDIRWTAAGSGDWATDGNWTQNTEPNSFHHTTIDPASSLTVTAPSTNTTVASLTLGGAAVATLRLNGTTTGDLRALQASTITGTGELHLNNGRTFSAPTLDNSGVIRGNGTVDALLANAGRVESIGEELAFSQLVTNNASTGLIAGEDATLRFNSGLTNNGAVALSFGTSRVFGDIANNGSIVVSGNANATFYDDITNSATINVSNGSTAVFFGALTGNGVAGGGTVFLEGDTRPGTSPAVMSFGGDVNLGFLHTLDIEIGGLVAGNGFDQLAVTADVSIEGTLDVTGINGFALSPGMVFEIITFGGSLSGSFSNIVNSTGLDGLILNVTSDADSLNLVLDGLAGDLNLDGFVGIDDLNAVLGNWNAGTPPPPGSTNIPEPGTLVLIGLGASALLNRSQR